MFYFWGWRDKEREEGGIDGYLYWRWSGRNGQCERTQIPNCSEIHVGCFFTLWNSHWKFNTQTTTWISAVKWPKWKYGEKPNHNTKKTKRMLERKKEHSQRAKRQWLKIHGFSPIVDFQFINSYFVCELLMANNNGSVEWNVNKQPKTHTHTNSHSHPLRAEFRAVQSTNEFLAHIVW